MARRFTVALGVLALIAAGALAAGLVLAFGGGSRHGLTREQYLARVNAICQAYGRRLDAIAPPDLGSPGDIFGAVSQVLPLLEQQAAKARAIEPPSELEADVDRFFSLTDRSITALREARRNAQRRDLAATAGTLTRFADARDAAKRWARRLGFRC